MASSDPLDLARCRALASDAGDRLDAIASLLLEMQAAMRRNEPVHPNDFGDDPATIKRLAKALATALRAACDEVERLREAQQVVTVESASVSYRPGEAESHAAQITQRMVGYQREVEWFQSAAMRGLALAEELGADGQSAYDRIFKPQSGSTQESTP